MALAIDGSTPAVATQTVGTVATITSASFTPPTGSTLLILWACDETTGGIAAPTITDNLGTHLTYTLSDWQSKADTPTVFGQCAAWTAPVGTSAAMTVTVTTGSVSGERVAALQVIVLTGGHATPVGAHGKNGSASAASIAQSYTAQASGGWGFIADCDFDAVGTQTAGTGCTVQSAGSVGANISYGFLKRTTADDTNGGSNTLNVTLPGTSTNLNWVYVEIVPAAGGTVGVAAVPTMLPPWLLYELAARNQAQWQNPASTIQADAGTAEIDQRSSTGAAGAKGGIGTGNAIAHAVSTESATIKGGQGGGRPSARAATSVAGIKGGIGSGTASARATTSNAATKAATGTGLAAQRSSTTAAKTTIINGTGTATQRTTTTSAAAKGGVGSGRPTAHISTVTAGRHQGIATAGIAPTRPATQVTAAHGATATGRATTRAATSVAGIQVAAFTPAYVSVDGSATGGSLDSRATGSSTDGASTPTGDLDGLAMAGATDGTTTASGYL